MAARNDRDPAAGPAGSPEPDESTLTMLRLALEGLPMEQRTAIRVAMTERLTVSQIAGRLGRTPQETKRAMRDGLSTLCDVLTAIDPGIASELGASAVPPAQ